MLTQKLMEDILDEAMLRGADFAEVFDEEKLFQETWVTQDEAESSQMGRESGVGIRLFRNKCCFYGSTNDRSEAAVLKKVKELALAMKTENISGHERTPFGPLRSCSMINETLRASSLPVSSRLKPAFEAARAGKAYDPEIVRMQVKLTDMEQQVQIANTDGLYVRDERIKTRLYISAYAQNGTDVESGYYGPGAMMGHDYYEKIDVAAAGREAARQAKIILHASPCRGGQMPVVVAHGFGGLLFHEACGHSLEASAISRGSSEFCGKLGQQVASDKVTLVDDGSIADEWGSLHVDDEGIPTQKNVLIEHGILRSYLVDRLNGLRGGFAPTGSSRRQSYKFAPTSRMTNTYIAPGESTPEEILRATHTGLYVASINGGSVDPATGAFNFNAGECYLIRNGAPAEPVRGITLIGTGGKVLQNVDMVGNDFELRQGFCFAASGALYIGAGQPTVRVSNMTVGGIG